MKYFADKRCKFKFSFDNCLYWYMHFLYYFSTVDSSSVAHTNITDYQKHKQSLKHVWLVKTRMLPAIMFTANAMT